MLVALITASIYSLNERMQKIESLIGLLAPWLVLWVLLLPSLVVVVNQYSGVLCSQTETNHLLKGQWRSRRDGWMSDERAPSSDNNNRDR